MDGGTIPWPPHPARLGRVVHLQGDVANDGVGLDEPHAPRWRAPSDRRGSSGGRPSGSQLAQEGAKQYRFDAGLAQDRSNQLTLPIEADGLPNEALDIVSHERAEQHVELVVRQLAE